MRERVSTGIQFTASWPARSEGILERYLELAMI